LLLTGGSSGIGLATAQILASRGAKVVILDLNPPSEKIDSERIEYKKCDVTDWNSLRTVFAAVGHIDIAVANAGVSEECDYFEDTYDSDGNLQEPRYNVVEVNYRAVLNFVKLSLSTFRKQAPGSSLVITSSATAYSPEQSLPVYSATKTAVSFKPMIPSSIAHRQFSL
jgi:NAD(P)-dependent dehydrogenase (short-subunit alcohol dehydrogenase family)